MHTLYLGLGSNLGDRRTYISQAIRLLQERVGEVESVSSIMETEPWGFLSDNKFLNAACRVSTVLTPEECLKETKEIERTLGRGQKSQGGVYHDRTIDIDLLMYDDLHICTPSLTLPHPRIMERDFVRIPLQEVMAPSDLKGIQGSVEKGGDKKSCI